MYGNFCPWVFETFGRWGPAFTRSVSLFETAVGPARALRLRQALRRHIAIAIQAGNADMIANALRTATKAHQAQPLSCFLLPAARALIEPFADQFVDRTALPPSAGVLLDSSLR